MTSNAKENYYTGSILKENNNPSTSTGIRSADSGVAKKASNGINISQNGLPYPTSSFQHRTYLEKSPSNKNECKFKIEFLVDDFEPKDIRLRLNGNVLSVEAARDELLSNENKSIKSNLKQTKKFKRDIELPEIINQETLTCYLETYENHENVLTIEAILNVNNSDFIDFESTLNKFNNKYLSNYNDRGNDFRRLAGLVNSQKSSSNQQSGSHVKFSENQTYDNSPVTNGGRLNRRDECELIKNTGSASARSKSMKSLRSVSSDAAAPKSLNETSSGYLKYKFNLKGYKSQNINLSIVKKSTLVINAVDYGSEDEDGDYDSGENNENDYDEYDDNDSYDSYNYAYGQKKSKSSRSGVVRVERKPKREFTREILLPENVELHKIRNLFDEDDGILRIEIPLISSSSKLSSLSYANSSESVGKNKYKSTQSLNNNNNNNISDHNSRFQGDPNEQFGHHKSYDANLNKTNSAGRFAATPGRRVDSMGPIGQPSYDRYLELMFDLFDFKYESYETMIDENNKKLLIVKASKPVNRSLNNLNSTSTNLDISSVPRKQFVRKYILPEWVSDQNIIVKLKTTRENNVPKNYLIMHLPILD
jgi:HSP20 family molecular chaperone IbpA